MNASQSKQILTVATRALALLNPEWQVTAELRLMLESASSVQAPAVKAKSGKIRKDAAYYTYKPIVGAPSHKTIWVAAPLRKTLALADYDVPRSLIQADPACLCAGCQIMRGFIKRGLNPVKMLKSNKPKFDKAAVISKLSLCACGGNADSHAKDELENLLKCSHCDTCEAFHYDVDASEAQAA